MYSYTYCHKQAVTFLNRPQTSDSTDDKHYKTDNQDADHKSVLVRLRAIWWIWYIFLANDFHPVYHYGTKNNHHNAENLNYYQIKLVFNINVMYQKYSKLTEKAPLTINNPYLIIQAQPLTMIGSNLFYIYLNFRFKLKKTSNNLINKRPHETNVASGNVFTLYNESRFRIK